MKPIHLGVLVTMMGWTSIEGAFFKGRSTGWHWYEPQRPVETPSDSKEKNSGTSIVQMTAKARLDDLRKQLDEALALAILEPTSEHIVAYQRLQHHWANQAHLFSKVWAKNVLVNPDLDATLDHPVTQYGVQIKKELDQQRREQWISTLSQQYGLFFMYQGQCRACQGMAKVLKRFSEKYGWKVLGISQDGVILPEFPDSQMENGISERWRVKAVPAVFVVNPETEQFIPVGFGLISLDQLERNLGLQFSEKGGK